MFNKDTYIQRRKQLRKDMQSGILLFPGNMEAACNYRANTYAFRQDSNFLYFFGLNHADYVGVIDVDNDQDWLFANDIDMDDIIWMGYLPSVKELASRVGVEHTADHKSLHEFIAKAMASGRKIHFCDPYRADTSMQMAALLDISPEAVKQQKSDSLIKAIIKQRAIKTGEEIVEIEKAINTAYKMHTTAMRMCNEGVYEYEIAGTMEGIALAGGGPVSFPVILSMHGETLHNHDHSQKLQKGRLVVADAGCETSMNYCSDITRTTPVGRKFSERQKEIYEAVLAANMLGIESTKPGTSYRDIHLKACLKLAEGLKNAGLMKGNLEDAVMQGAHALFMPHGLGHMMGLDVHDMENLGEMFVGYTDDLERSKQFGLAFLRMGRKLEPGFVLTVEPGCYFIPALIDLWKGEGKFKDYLNYDRIETYKDFGGIRIEDDVLVTETSGRVLGKAIPKTVNEIENLA